MAVKGSRIVVTGASAGIGKAVAVDLARHGARVWAVARREDRLQALAAEHEGITALAADVSTADGRRALLDEVGHVDVLVNNAGTAWAGSFEEMTDEDVERIVGLNLIAVVELCRLVAPQMLERGSGQIVNIGSILGFAPGPPLTLYSATKSAVHAFSDGLRRELHGRGVFVSVVAPGPVEATEALDDTGDDDDVNSTLQVAFDKVGTQPDEVAEAVRTAIEHPGRPGNRTITVPRVAGLSRLAQAPVVSWTMDQGFALLRKAGVKIG